MADDLSLTLLRSLLPDLHRDVKAGDVGARRELVRVLGQIERIEARARGFDTAQTPTQPTDGQRGFTAPVGAPGQDVSRMMKAEFDQRLAGMQLRDELPPRWLELYDALLDERGEDGKRRWDWRKALYIAWHCTPREQREPQTVGGLAKRLGVATSTMRAWRAKDAEIERRIAELPRLLLMDHLASVYEAVATLASTPDPKTFPDRRLFLELTGQYSPRTGVEFGGEVAVVAVTAAERIAAMQRAQQRMGEIVANEGDAPSSNSPQGGEGRSRSGGER